MSRGLVNRGGKRDFLSVSGLNDGAWNIPSFIYEGIVNYVIIDSKSQEFVEVDGYNVGDIRVRIMGYTETLPESELDWAFPMDSTVSEYPLRGELVTLYKIRNQFFYTKKIPIAKRPQENSLLQLEEYLSGQSIRSKILNQEDLLPEKQVFGEYYRPDKRVRRLKHFEGDTIIEGRRGNSIRLGSGKMDPLDDNQPPNIILRTGQAKNLESERVTIKTIFGSTIEDINKDISSIWMVADQTVPFTANNENISSFNRSIKNPPQDYSGGAIYLNSDKLILNTKRSHLLMYSSEEIYMNSYGRTSIDSDDSIFLTANLDITQRSSRNYDILVDGDYSSKSGNDMYLLSNNKMSLVSGKVHIGGTNNTIEPMVGGTSLSIFLARLIGILMGVPPQYAQGSPQAPPYQLAGLPVPPSLATLSPQVFPSIATFSHVTTPFGPGVLNPQIMAGLITLYNELALPNLGTTAPVPFTGAPFNSYDNFVGLSNEDVSSIIPENNYESTEPPIVVENNEYDINADYYGVE